MATLAVHVTPKAGRDEVVGWRGGELQVRVTVAPEGGKANAAVCVLLAAVVGIAKSNVRVMRGETSRHKLVELAGVADDRLREAFGEPEASLF